MTKTLFPFSAVVGQHDYKLALLLLAVDPHLGGVVVSGPRGTAKSTLARGFSELLNLEQSSAAPDAAPFVNLPLGASEEMLVGTMDLEQVLQERTQRFRPGLLAQAHQGVLYVDEVNLLPDTLVDVLLDVSASGVNRVERDGVSHSHAADFVLVGTMNPDEGELRPQLLDRFGFCVELNDQFTAKQRVEVIKARQAFDQNAETFRASFAAEQAQLAKSIQSARERLSSTALEDSQLLDIAERCAEAQVDGFRADIVWAKAAKAHAAWRGANTVGSLDIDAVQELVLRHRRQQANSSSTPPSQPDPNNRSRDQEQSPPPFRRPPESRRDSAEQPSGSSEQAENDWGQMSTEAHADIQAMDPTYRAALDDVLAKTSGDTLNGGRVSKQNAPKRISWFQTCLQSLPAWPPKTLSWQAKPQRGQTLHMLVLDTSASMREGQQFSAAKGVVQDVFRSAYLKREWVSAISFGNAAAKPIFERLRAPKQIDTWLNTIETGGGTPLLEGLEAAKQHALQVLKLEPKLAIKFYVISDGRSLANLSALTLPGQTVWVDIEQSAVSRGRGRDLAEQLRAHYFHLFQHSFSI